MNRINRVSRATRIARAAGADMGHKIVSITLFGVDGLLIMTAQPHGINAVESPQVFFSGTTVAAYNNQQINVVADTPSPTTFICNEPFFVGNAFGGTWTRVF